MLIHKENKNSPLWEEVIREKNRRICKSIDKINYQVLSASKVPVRVNWRSLVTMFQFNMFTYDQTLGDTTYDGFLSPI